MNQNRNRHTYGNRHWPETNFKAYPDPGRTGDNDIGLRHGQSGSYGYSYGRGGGRGGGKGGGRGRGRGHGHGYGHGYGQGRRGRRRSPRRVDSLPPVAQFNPQGIMPGETETVILTIEELETVRLVDEIGLDQQEAAHRMGISRKSFWTELKAARWKIATALANGYVIRIEGGDYVLEDDLY